MNTTHTISNSDDLIDIRHVIERYEELEGELESAQASEREKIAADAALTNEQRTEALEECSEDFEKWLTYVIESPDGHQREEDVEEYLLFRALLDACRGNGGDEKWRGDWYPVTLIRESYFEDYARELAEDIGAIDRNATWPNNYIDWGAATDALRQDYMLIDFDGVDYWTR